MATSEWAQAGAVVDRIWDAYPLATIASQRDWDGVAVWVAVDPDEPDEMLCVGKGPTYVAALIDLGRQWAPEGQNRTETRGRGARMTGNAFVLVRYAVEAEMEAAIKEAVELRGGRCWHVRDSRRTDVEDMPDLVIVLPPLVAFVEAKSQRRRVTDGQRQTMDLLSQCDRVWSGIMRPVPRDGEWSYDDVIRLLAGEPGERA